ncbi:kinase-like protein [Peniophora sp. CONT]|nr:kinase-like protein [Peniophora sp. CONT]
MSNLVAPRLTVNPGQRVPGILPRPSSTTTAPSAGNRKLYSSPLSYRPIPLSLSQFTPLRKLGKGGFGTVYHVRDGLSGRNYALKIVDKSTVKPQHIGLILREQIAHQALSASESPSFLPMHASWHDTGYFYMLTELQNQGDLRSDMKRTGIYPREKVAVIAAELLLCIEDLHARRMMHRDLKPDNVLIGDDGHLMLADFGMIRMFVEPDATSCAMDTWASELHALAATGDDDDEMVLDVTKLPCGTPRYMAQEVLEGKWYSYGAELWSVGVILYMMLTGRVPYKASKNDRKTQLQVLLTKSLTFVEGELDWWAEDLIRGLLRRDPSQRLTIADAKRHPFFDKVNWRTLRTGPGVLPYTPKPTSVSFNDSEEITLNMGSPYGGEMGPDPYPGFTFLSGGFQVERFAASLVTPRSTPVVPPAAPSRPLRPLSQPYTIRAPRALNILPGTGSIRKLFVRDDDKGYTRPKEVHGKENSREWLLPHEHVEQAKARVPPPNIAERRRTGRPEVHYEDGLDSMGEWRARHRKALLVESRAPPAQGYDADRRVAPRKDVRSVFSASNR